MIRKFVVLLALVAVTIPATGCNKKKKRSGDAFACSSGNRTLTLSQVDPSSGYDQANTVVSVLSSGGGFVATPQIHVGFEPLTNVTFLNASSITGVLEAGVAPGVYDVVVTNPDGSCGVLEDAFTVSTEPPPSITNVSPGRVDTGFAGNLIVTGNDFDTAATASLQREDGTEIPLTVLSVSTAGTSGQSLTATGAIGAAGVGVYLVRVTNPDGQYDRFSALVVTNPSGKLTDFEDSGNALLTGRVWPGVAAGSDDLGNRFIYAVGGSNATGILKSVEVAPVDLFGNLGAWSETQPLGSARWGAAVVEHGGWLYAIAGVGTAGQLASVERASILPNADAPAIGTAPWQAAGSLSTPLGFARAAVIHVGAQPFICVIGNDGSAVFNHYECGKIGVGGAVTWGEGVSDLTFDSRLDFGIAVTSSATTPGFTGNPQITMLAGRDPASTNAVQTAAVVGSSGALGTVTAQSGVQGSPSGLQVIQANAYVYAIGGGGYNAGGVISPTSTVSQNDIDPPSSGTFGNWSSASVSLLSTRYGMGVCLQGPFIYVVGGLGTDPGGATDVPLASVEQTIY